MSLASGSRLGPYVIGDPLGAGGMGEVYRARDTVLDRDVAIKVLPERFAQDHERLARLEREAKTLATLNHPNIAAIYGLEDRRALVLELVEGPTLADRIIQGPIPVEDARDIARQIAEALAAAHGQGIVHRDLKPANIKVRTDGTVKVLDFGLAKLTDVGVTDSAGVSISPTLTSPAMMTGVGVILGTAAYMAPEQVKGNAADTRSDLWAFACVLYEMLTGARAFRGEDVSDTFVAILRDEPDWNRLPVDLHGATRTLLQRCLAKDRRKRIADISVVRFLLDEPTSLATDEPGAATQAVERPWWRRVVALAAVALAAVAAAAVGVWFALSAEAPPVGRFLVLPPDNATFSLGGRSGVGPAVSPDGRTLAFTARDPSGRESLWVRPIDSLTAQRLAGTDGAQLPFWSPDSRFIAYFAQGRLLKIPLGGGPAQTLCMVTSPRGGTWGRDGVIVFSTDSLFRVSASGGQPSAVIPLASGHTAYRSPSLLPDGRHILYYVQGAEDVSGVYVASLDTGTTSRLVGADSSGVYDSQSGHMLFVRQGTLLAQRLDLTARVLTDEPFPIAEQVESSLLQGLPAFSVSDNGLLAYGIGAGLVSLQMAWVDRVGRTIGTVGPEGAYRGVDLAPGGTRVAAHRHEGQGGDIWVSDLVRGTTSRFTFDASHDNSSPIWSPDGSRIAFSSFRAGKWGLYEKPSNGTGAETRLVEAESAAVPMAWSPDGGSLLYWIVHPTNGGDLWLLPLSGERKAVPVLNTPFAESHGQISPDGRWLAYHSNETGQNEVYVQPFPAGSGKWQVSTRGGVFPRWRADGRELFYTERASESKVIGVDVKSSGATFEAGPPRQLFDSGYINLSHPGNYHTYAVSADGQRFLIPRPVADAKRSVTNPIVVVLNWAEGIRR